ncbi:MAG: ABC transporter ATP-binding protein [Reinekea sp.]|nr:ABC transporter ATP-binding protein [Reinekea sp.]
MLTIENINVNYHHAVQVLKGFSLTVNQGEITALLGANGAGKTTVLKAASGLLGLENGHIEDGQIQLDGVSILKTKPHMLARNGLVHVREGRRIFAEMSVEDNLTAASYALTGRHKKADYQQVYDFFPRLKERSKQLAGLLSGGEQQMLAIGRAILAQPKLILLDEPSLGLAPKIVDEIFEIVRRINQERGVSMLLVEQNAAAAFRVAHQGYILENGKVVLEGSIDELKQNKDIQTFYLGMGEHQDASSFRDVKHYKRRKRWLN